MEKRWCEWCGNSLDSCKWYYHPEVDEVCLCKTDKRAMEREYGFDLEECY